MADRVVYFLRVRPSIRDAFKASCAIRGRNMTETLIALIQAYLSNPEAFEEVLEAHSERALRRELEDDSDDY